MVIWRYGMNRNYYFIVAIILAMTCFRVAHAGSMSCGDVFISPGDSQADVREKCGEPAVVRQNQWYYTPPGSLTTVISFGGGVVQSIDEGELPDPNDTGSFIGDSP
jgi:hypothetical protein